LLLTNVLPNQGNGDYRLHVYADDPDGHTVLLGSRRILGKNASSTQPFGAIDTPRQGETVSGTIVDFGWALTPQPESIATDGSTIHVLIDGGVVGTVDYNHFRSDVSTLFPGLANSNGPVGFRMIDTTQLSEGIHTIAWQVTDSAGAVAGIGSRFFSVTNSGLAVVASEAIGWNTSTVDQLQKAETDDDRVLGAKLLDRFELNLEARRSTPAALEIGQACAARYEGYLVVDGEMRPLPAGAALEERGVFTWQPGAGFNGTYELLFLRTECSGARERLPVRVAVGPR
jgi:hypothetical protein